MHRGGFTLIEMLLIVAVVAIIAIIALPLLSGRRGTEHSAQCPTNLMQFGIAFQQYNQDNGRRFPRVSVNSIVSGSSRLGNPYGWADAIYPYIKNPYVYQCPGEGHRDENTATQSGFTDYWMNARLSGLEEVRLPDKETGSVVLLGEGNDGEEVTDARYAKRNLPFDWLQNKNSPAYRHNGGANYLFADGHVRFIPANSALNLTFRPTLKPKH